MIVGGDDGVIGSDKVAVLQLRTLTLLGMTSLYVSASSMVRITLDVYAIILVAEMALIQAAQVGIVATEDDDDSKSPNMLTMTIRGLLPVRVGLGSINAAVGSLDWYRIC